MKTLTLLFALMLVSCGTVVQEHNVKCNKTKQEIISAFSALGMRENMMPKMADANIGYARLESLPANNLWIGGTDIRVWQLQVDDTGTIIATAFNQHSTNTTTYYGDNTHEDWTWYWNIRKGLQQLCGDSVRITQREQ